MKILALILSVFLLAAPTLAQDSAAPQTSEQQREESFSKDIARMFIGLMERMLVEMKHNMLGEEVSGAPCNCNCAPQGEEV